MRRIEIDSSLLEVSPDVKLGCIFYTATVEYENEALWHFIGTRIEELSLCELTTERLMRLPRISDARMIQKKLGSDPYRHRVSPEALIRRLISGKGLYKVNNIVDIGNLLSVESCFPTCSYDLDKIGGYISFRKGTSADSFKGIGSKERINTENLPVLADEFGAFGCTTSDSERTMITSATKSIMTVIKSFSNEALDLTNAIRYIQNFTDAKDIRPLLVTGKTTVQLL